MVTTYINQRGGDKSMIPSWLDAGVTHAGMGVDIGDDRRKVIFGRIFGDNGRVDVGVPVFFSWPCASLVAEIRETR